MSERADRTNKTRLMAKDAPAPDLTAVLLDLLRPLIREEIAKERAAQERGSELMTTADAATIARVKPPTIREWVAKGRLRARLVSGRYMRFTRADLDAAMAGPKRQNLDPVSLACRRAEQVRSGER
ncbi:MAG: hypothetical protein JWO36_5669 [Myxococcales bacterium]|nr:hypothetical protein [Myxococcales bacterium]